MSLILLTYKTQLGEAVYNNVWRQQKSAPLQRSATKMARFILHGNSHHCLVIMLYYFINAVYKITYELTFPLSMMYVRGCDTLFEQRLSWQKYSGC